MTAELQNNMTVQSINVTTARISLLALSFTSINKR